MTSMLLEITAGATMVTTGLYMATSGKNFAASWAHVLRQ
jgi:hypothetical protein